jgi:hypothetical protein
MVDSVNPGYNIETSSDELFIRNSLARYGNHGDVKRLIGSWIGHFSYIFKNKYSVSVASNYDYLRDGMYLDERKLFPSIAINWDMAQEPFFNKLDWLDQLNVNLNWGKAGYFPINTISDEQFIATQFDFGDKRCSINPLVVSNEYIRPEYIEEVNIGIHTSLLNSRINLSANYYTRTNNNLIVQSQLSILYGEGLAFINIGEMKGSGKEYGIEVIPVLQSGFSWYSRVGFSHFTEKITRLNHDGEFLFTDPDILIPDLLIEEGAPWKYLWL